jgi:hypothetical protein
MFTSMEPRTLQYIAKACAGEQLTGSPDALVRRVCTDSRAVRPGDLFFALSGDKFDGHEFLKEVMGKDAAAVVVNRQRLPVPSLSCGVIAVENTRQALARLAAEFRHDFNIPTVAVGGSNGKTTTKEIVLTLALTCVRSPEKRMLSCTLAVVRLTVRPIQQLEISKTRRTILPLLGGEGSLWPNVADVPLRARDFWWAALRLRVLASWR